MTEQERIYEHKNLESVLEEIERQIARNSAKAESYLNSQIEANKSMWEDVQDPTDLDDVAIMKQYIDAIKYIARTREFYNYLIKKLNKMKYSPYFGRIDFKEDGTAKSEKIYIGISNLEDEQGDIMVYDWRAPVSSMFYDYETGAAQYNSPSGIISGEVELKRQYKIGNGKIEYMFDSNLKIDDEILQEILSKSVDNKMKTIVTTIQREQNRVIRDEDHRLLLVQGPAGSGKTSIALHRVAFLLYRYKDTITARNIVIFSPNQVFSDYISGVLPELGEENAFRTTFFEYALRNLDNSYMLEDMNDQMEYLLTTGYSKEYDIRVEAIKLKGSMEFKHIINKYVSYFEKEGFNFTDLKLGNNVVLSKDKLYNLFVNDYNFLPIIKRVEKIKNRFEYLLKPLEKKRYAELLEEAASSGKYVDKNEMKAKCRLIVREEVKPLYDSLNRMTEFNIYDLYKQLFKKPDIYKKLNNGRLPDNFEEISRFTVESVESKTLYYEDVFPLLYLKGLIGDIPVKPDIKHVIIDEAQDYTPMQYDIIKQLFPDSSFTMLGDLNQSINPLLNVGTYENISDIFPDKKGATIKLSKSYRSTREIAAFCHAILDEKNDVDFVQRPGKKPVIIKCEDEDDIARHIEVELEQIKKRGLRSVAVICKTNVQSRNLYQKLRKNIDIHLITKDDAKFNKGVVVVPSYLAKGLEFDIVFIYNAGEESYKDERERRLFYTACTRALHELNIYYTREITPFLKNIDRELYEEKY
ncbi:MAG TPA: AAA family ATPase [Clostridiaceae bacterium]|nr:AAA family ATPase [Clostridiaceae bacterium]